MARISDGRVKNGGPRPRTGPRVRHIHLDDATSEMVRTLTKERRAVSPAITEHKLVMELIRDAWSERDQEYQERGEQE